MDLKNVCNDYILVIVSSEFVKKTSRQKKLNMENFPSGQREQTVNLLRIASVVRIHHSPPFYFNFLTC